MFVPLLLTLHVWQAPPLRAPIVELPLAASAPAGLLDLSLGQLQPSLTDPYANSFSGLEVMAGVGGSVVGAFAGTVFAIGVGAMACAISPDNHSDIPACLAWAMLAWAVAELGLPPLFASAGAILASPSVINGSFGRSVGYAYAAQGIGLAISIGLGLVTIPLGGAGFLVGWVLTELVAVPIAASRGLHDGAPVEGASPPATVPQEQTPPQLAPPPSYTPDAPPPPINLPPPPATVGFAFPF